jgi:ABC-type arginine transport system ATPase subunit
MRPLSFNDNSSVARSYPAPWKGEIILACKRCQKRLRKSRPSARFARLRKWVHAKVRKDKLSAPVHLVEIPCQKICPKNGIVVCNRAQLSEQPARFSIISSGRQMRRFCNASAAMPEQSFVQLRIS